MSKSQNPTDDDTGDQPVCYPETYGAYADEDTVVIYERGASSHWISSDEAVQLAEVR